MDTEMLLTPPQENENNREYACRILRTNIMTLRMAPGQPINEGELAEFLHMSRTPVHEALTALKDKWLVEILPQRGTRVSCIDPTLVKEGYSARLLLEGALLRDEAGKIGHAQVQMLMDNLRCQEALFDRMPEAVDEYIREDDEFHRMMYYFGGRSRTWAATRGLISHYDRMRYLDALSGNADYAKIFRQHREFCDYLLMGLPPAVDPQQKIAEHLASFRGDLLAMIARYPNYFTV